MDMFDKDFSAIEEGERERTIDLVNGALKEQFDYVPLAKAINVANELLAKDVKPIIRCKDCAYYDHGECTMLPICLGGDFYCGRAEPKE